MGWANGQVKSAAPTRRHTAHPGGSWTQESEQSIVHACVAASVNDDLVLAHETRQADRRRAGCRSPPRHGEPSAQPGHPRPGEPGNVAARRSGGGAAGLRAQCHRARVAHLPLVHRGDGRARRDQPALPADGARCRAGAQPRRLHPRADRHRQRRRHRAPPDRAVTSARCGRLHRRDRPVAATRCSTSSPTHTSRRSCSTGTPPVRGCHMSAPTTAPGSPWPSTTWSRSDTAGSAMSPVLRTPRPDASEPPHFGRPFAATGCRTSRSQVRVCAAYTEAAGAVVARSLIRSGHDCTAILAGNDLIAFGVLSELTKAGISCPQQMSVIGFNDLPLVDKLTPPLTTVRVPLAAMGSLAAQILLTRDRRHGRQRLDSAVSTWRGTGDTGHDRRTIGGSVRSTPRSQKTTTQPPGSESRHRAVVTGRVVMPVIGRRSFAPRC